MKKNKYNLGNTCNAIICDYGNTCRNIFIIFITAIPVEIGGKKFPPISAILLPYFFFYLHLRQRYCRNRGKKFFPPISAIPLPFSFFFFFFSFTAMVFPIFFLPISAMQLSQVVCHFYFSHYFNNDIVTIFFFPISAMSLPQLVVTNFFN